MFDNSEKKNWVTPTMKTFGTSEKDKPKKYIKQGPNCGESIIRYGSHCRIRTGQHCKIRVGHQCTPSRFGPSCTDRAGYPCKPFKDEPTPPKIKKP